MREAVRWSRAAYAASGAHYTWRDFLEVSTGALEVLLKYLRRIRNARLKLFFILPAHIPLHTCTLTYGGIPSISLRSYAAITSAWPASDLVEPLDKESLADRWHAVGRPISIAEYAPTT